MATIQATEIVSVTVNRATANVSRVGFGTLLIADEVSAAVATIFGTDRVREYTRTSGMLTDGFLATDTAFLAATAAFSQSPRPDSIKVGRRVAPVAQVSEVNVDAVINDQLYTVTIAHASLPGGTVDATFTSDADATDLEIRDGLIAAIDGNAALFALVDADIVDSDTLDITAQDAGATFIVTVDSNLSTTTPTPSVGIETDLAAIVAADDDWYGLMETSRLVIAVFQAAAFVQAHISPKLFIAQLNDTSIKDDDADNPASRLKDLAFSRTGLLWHLNDVEFADAAWFGRRLPTIPGELVWNGVELVGITKDDLTQTEINGIHANNANTYVLIAGVGWTQEGKVASGLFMDQVRGQDHMTTRLAEAVFGALADAGAKNTKIPFTDAGGAALRGVTEGSLQDRVNEGYLESFTVTVPLVATISAADKAARDFTGIEVIALEAGAVQTVSITIDLS